MLCAGILLKADSLMELLLFSSLHELGHLTCLYLCKGSADEIRLAFYGFAVKYSCVLQRYKEFLVILCGPAVNLILYIIFRDEINLLLFIVNILPIYPLDGGRLVNILFPSLTKYLSAFFLVCLITLSIIILVKFNSFSLILICVYLLVYSVLY